MFSLRLILLAVLGCASVIGYLMVDNVRFDQNHANAQNTTPNGCDSNSISKALRKFSSGKYSESHEASRFLLQSARKSSACRATVISSLMDAMDQPGLDFERQISNYYLWRGAAMVLGELKATEALTLLISHLHLTAGYHSASQVFRPAILGVVEMGPVAIPDLAAALRQYPDRDVRMGAVYCLTSIGGRDAMNALRAAQGSESDKCIARFIEISLATFVYKSTSGEIMFSTSAPRANPNARMKWLEAFECVSLSQNLR